MDTENRKYIKWGLIGVVCVGLLVFLAPILSKLVLDLATIAVVGVGLAGLAIFLPAIIELFMQGSYWLWSNTIKADPVAKLWRDFKEFLKEIDKVQENINLVATEEENAKMELDKNRKNFDRDEITAYSDQINGITEAKLFLMGERDKLKEESKQMEKDIRKNESHWKMGNALVRAAKAVDRASGISTGTDGGRVAMDTIQARLAEGRARLNVLRSQRSVTSIQEAMKARTINVEAKEVPAPKALENNPSKTPFSIGTLTLGEPLNVPVGVRPQHREKTILDNL